MVSPSPTAQRWMQFAGTAGTIVTSTVLCVWAVMVYALDREYVQIEDFEAFKHEIKADLKDAVGEVHCAAMQQKLMELNTTISFKGQAGQDARLEKLLRDNQEISIKSDRRCLQ
jgi:DNA-binding protein YbaB